MDIYDGGKQENGECQSRRCPYDKYLLTLESDAVTAENNKHPSLLSGHYMPRTWAWEVKEGSGYVVGGAIGLCMDESED